MDIIKSFLDNIFQAIPKTEETVRLKNELLEDMETKYHELRQTGKSENEAIGKVIGEFGDINELLDELGIVVHEKDSTPVLPIEKAREFLSLSSKASRLVGVGVFIILFGVAILIGLSAFIENNLIFPSLSESLNHVLPVILFLLMIIPAVALFIYSGTIVEKFKFIEEGDFKLDFSAKSVLKEESTSFEPKRTLAVVIGVGLCIFAVILLLVISSLGDNFSQYGVCLLLVMVAIAAFIFIYIGSIASAYEQLLKAGEFEPEKKHTNKVVGGVAALVWPITTCVFLIWGFVYDGWGISWIVFPVTGILFGGFSALYAIVKNKN